MSHYLFFIKILTLPMNFRVPTYDRCSVCKSSVILGPHPCCLPCGECARPVTCRRSFRMQESVPWDCICLEEVDHEVLKTRFSFYMNRTLLLRLSDLRDFGVENEFMAFLECYVSVVGGEDLSRKLKSAIETLYVNSPTALWYELILEKLGALSEKKNSK